MIRKLSHSLETHSLLEDVQFGFQPGHGNDSALVTALDELRMRVDGGQSSGLIMLDLPIAFDTGSHSILLDRLAAIGVGGLVLEWMNSYLENRAYLTDLNVSTCVRESRRDRHLALC
ncbi:hypothetical protein NDU88_008173 [Pleurodeles waltl]|uniref:Reverse transcriptase n=1 Tax=Pleurodeles waltl TaxID=8319 RepID=A0AAV7N6A1_PLEWA|nr:hypothetical protein NDU88_008173 [Pleurodeles waltl]